MNWPPAARGSREAGFMQPRAHLLADPCMLVAFPPLGTWYNHRRETNVNMAPSLTQPRFHPFPDDCGYRVRSFRSILSRSRCSFAVFPPLFPSNALREVNIMDGGGDGGVNRTYRPCPGYPWHSPWRGHSPFLLSQVG